jgi:hypothetical protein
LLANKIDGLGEINEIAGLGKINKIAGLGKLKQNCPTWWRNKQNCRTCQNITNSFLGGCIFWYISG